MTIDFFTKSEILHEIKYHDFLGVNLKINTKNMKAKADIRAVFILAILYAFLFHNKPLGLNLLIFDLLVLTVLVINRHIRLFNLPVILIMAAYVITSAATVFVYSFWAYFIHFLVFMLFIGTLVYPTVRSYLHAFHLFLYSMVMAPATFLKKLSETRFKGRNMGVYLRKSRIFIIPLLIIIVFIVIYRNSNPVFDEMMRRIGTSVNDALVWVFGSFDVTVFITFFLGLFFCAIILFRSFSNRTAERYIGKSDAFTRIKTRLKRRFPVLGLKNELKAGLFLFLILNVILLTVNIIDINWVWFHFSWNGTYLKQFVYEGTYLLIFSILISVALVLYYFRGNLSFYSRNKWLKYLSYIWLLQNAVLAVSVGIRNFWYIYYFSLAYKRIGVYIFLLLTLYGLYTVFVKVKCNKSAFYLFRTNARALVIILVVSTLFNWDCIIARYNFSNYNRSFVHLNFLAKLSNKALPYLDKSMDELLYIDSVQKEKFPFEYKYMAPDEYYERIRSRKQKFKNKWENKNWYSWNYPEAVAYRKLFGNGEGN